MVRTRSLSITKDSANREMHLPPLLDMVASGGQDESMVRHLLCLVAVTCKQLIVSVAFLAFE